MSNLMKWFISFLFSFLIISTLVGIRMAPAWVQYFTIGVYYFILTASLSVLFKTFLLFPDKSSS